MPPKPRSFNSGVCPLTPDFGVLVPTPGLKPPGLPYPKLRFVGCFVICRLRYDIFELIRLSYMYSYLQIIDSYRYTFIAGPTIALICSVLSVYVVLRRMAMISEGVSHAGYGGIGTALLLGYYFSFFDTSVWQQVITALFCLGTALLIGYITRAKKVTEDSAIGIFLVAALALGTLLIDIRRRFPDGLRNTPMEMDKLLFGDIGFVTKQDMWVALTAAAVILGFVYLFYYELLYTTLDEEMARVNGVRTRIIHSVLLALISVTIVVSVRMVGFLMITALTIIPGATATMLSRKFGHVMATSICIGVGGVTGSLFLAISYPFSRYSSGPIIVLTLFVIFASVWVFRHFIRPSKFRGDPHGLGHVGHVH